LTGLDSNTTYYVVIESTDAAGNVTTSATFSAKTAVIVDTTAPVISSIAHTTGSSTSTITWLTNEPATSKVFFGTSTPLNIATAMNSGTTTLSTSHSVTLTGLATSTAHYFKVQSTDASANVQTSSEFAATTTSGL
ncbi:MAG: hypothetical protein M3Q80_02450, partial [bacterium]|nr:hypothetical protein [bacterium]